MPRIRVSGAAVLRRIVLVALAGAATLALAQETSPLAPDVPAKKFVAPMQASDYDKRVVEIPMRDGVKLHTVIVIPKGAKNAPMILTRTPYNADKRAERSISRSMLATMPQGDEVFVQAGYIRIFQDIRGKYGSQGDYVMTRPLIGPLNNSKVDHSTDAWDTIDWLVKNVKESNGRVGMLGSSYEGFTVVMALVNPHPALKVAAPESPMVDGWMGDDWFHYGAFRQTNFDYIIGQTTERGEGKTVPRDGYDDYTNFLRAGSAGDYARAQGMEQLAFWRKLTEHPAYDGFWQHQALDKVMAAQSLAVPVLWEQGLWDQEDMWGAIHCYAALEGKDTNNDRNFLVMGPWRHSQANYEGNMLGPLVFDGDSALQFRRDVLKPFFDQYLVEGAPKANTPPVMIYNTGENHWDRFNAWPLACEGGCQGARAGVATEASRPLYFGAQGTLSFTPAAGEGAFDEFVSDPAKPVPYQRRPVHFGDGDAWKRWLVDDQRFVDGRPDVLTFETDVLTAPVRVAGAPIVHLVASTSGSDSDWVVKLIDVYPESMPSRMDMGGYELGISMDIFRGRYREGFDKPTAIAANQPLVYRFAIPTVNHVFEPGHRIMVQVQSSWFPLYDRNPQTFVPNIFLAKPADYRKATQRVYHGGEQGSFISLPVIPAGSAAQASAPR